MSEEDRGDELAAWKRKKRKEARERERAERQAAWNEFFASGPFHTRPAPRRPDQHVQLQGLELYVYGKQTMWQVTDLAILEVPIKQANPMHAYFRLGGKGTRAEVSPGEARDIFLSMLEANGALTRRGEKILSMIPDDAADIDEELKPIGSVYGWWERWWPAIADTLPDEEEDTRDDSGHLHPSP